MRVLGKAAAVVRQHWRSLRLQLALLYAGVFAALGAVLLGVSGLLVRTGSASVGGGPGSSQSAFSGRQFEVGPALAFLAAAAIAVVLGWLIAGRFLRPLRTITSTARDISASNLNRRLGIAGRDDEFSELGETLDGLFGRLEAAFEAQRHFVANASHELRTPLAAERTLLQVTLADPDASAQQLRSACLDVLALGEQQERLIDALLTLATSETGIDRREDFDLADLAGKAISDRRAEAQSLDVAIVATLNPAQAAGDPSLAACLVANLVDNAIRHNSAGGRAEISTAQVSGRAVLSVRNTGPEVPPGEVDRLFQPFRQLGSERTRHGSGHGLGLAIVRAIAGAHGATVEAEAGPGGGLAIKVSFP